MINSLPFFLWVKSGNISRKFLTFILKIFDKNFERLHFFIIKTQTLWKIISTAQLRRRHPCSLLELSAEAGRVHIAHSQADVIDRHVRVEQ